MSRTVSGAKILGKTAAAVMIIILAAVLLLSSYIGGQDKTLQKYCAALSMGSLSDWESTLGTAPSGMTKDGFNALCRGKFTALPQFAELSDTDSIGSRVKIKERRMNGSPDRWICTADVDFYSSGESVSYDNTLFELAYKGGKWYISEVSPPARDTVFTISQ